jgi:G protein-coupled receptor GPR1
MCVCCRVKPLLFAPGTFTQPVLEPTTDPSAKWAEISGPVPPIKLSCCKSGSSDYMDDMQVAPSSSACAEIYNSFPSPDERLIHERRDRSPNTFGSASRQNLRARRQLRLIFIYPLVYTLMWLIPFAHHCTMYIEIYAQHPLWSLRLGATICISSMGFIDCLIFFLRERPWQSIPTSDGTFLGSFMVWKPHISKRTGFARSQDAWTRKRG